MNEIRDSLKYLLIMYTFRIKMMSDEKRDDSSE